MRSIAGPRIRDERRQVLESVQDVLRRQNELLRELDQLGSPRRDIRVSRDALRRFQELCAPSPTVLASSQAIPLPDAIRC
jgi:hypothetical protein